MGTSHCINTPSNMREYRLCWPVYFSKTKFWVPFLERTIRVCENPFSGIFFSMKYLKWCRDWVLYFNIKHCVKSVRIRSFSGPYFPAFGLNTKIYSADIRIQFKCRKTPFSAIMYQWLSSGQWCVGSSILNAFLLGCNGLTGYFRPKDIFFF